MSENGSTLLNVDEDQFDCFERVERRTVEIFGNVLLVKAQTKNEELRVKSNITTMNKYGTQVT